MKSIFSPEGVLFNIAEKIGNLMILNFIYMKMYIMRSSESEFVLHYVNDIHSYCYI